MTLRPIAIAPPPEDALLADMIGARALALALDIGLMDAVVSGVRAIAEIARVCRAPEAGLASIVDILVGSGALSRVDGGIEASPQLIAAMRDRDRLVQKLLFIDLASRDLAEHLPDLLLDTPRFIARGRVFGLFRYERCLTPTPADIAFTRRWVDYTTALTRYEGAVVAPHLYLEGRRHLLDVGGNSGEFARLLCQRNEALCATIFDLPVVTLIGQAHVASSPEATRLRFMSGDLRRDPLPGGHDVISFKSVLHDWPLPDALAFLDKAAQSLERGGSILIFERGPLDLSAGPFPYWMLANIVFAPFYRAPDAYAQRLAQLGFADIAIRRIDLETPFHILTAEKQ